MVVSYVNRMGGIRLPILHKTNKEIGQWVESLLMSIIGTLQQHIISNLQIFCCGSGISKNTPRYRMGDIGNWVPPNSFNFRCVRHRIN